jgi:hypothetical protein
MEQEIKEVANIIRHKKMTVTQAVYINNKVIILRLEYRGKVAFLTEQQYYRLQIPIRGRIKHAFHMASSMTNNVLEYHNLGAFIPYWYRQNKSHFTKFLLRLNDTSWSNFTLKARLMHASLMIGSYNIFAESPV